MHAQNWMSRITFSYESLETQIVQEAVNFDVNGNIGPFNASFSGARTTINNSSVDVVTGYPHNSPSPPVGISNTSLWWARTWASRIQIQLHYQRYRLYVMGGPCPGGHYDPNIPPSLRFCTYYAPYQKVVYVGAVPGTIIPETPKGCTLADKSGQCINNPALGGDGARFERATRMSPDQSLALTFSHSVEYKGTFGIKFGVSKSDQLPATANTETDTEGTSAISVSGNASIGIENTTDKANTSTQALTIVAERSGPGGCIYGRDESYQPTEITHSANHIIYASTQKLTFGC